MTCSEVTGFWLEQTLIGKERKKHFSKMGAPQRNCDDESDLTTLYEEQTADE